MSTPCQEIPPGRLWLPVHDLSSAMAALELLREHCPDRTDTAEQLPNDDL